MSDASQQKTEKTISFTEKEREFVFGVAMKYLKDEEEARDVTQDAMLLAYRHRASFRGDSRFTTWLYRIAATTALMHLRKRRRSPQLMHVYDDGPVIEPRATDPSPEDVSLSNEALRTCAEGLEHMGDKYEHIFRLRFLEGYSESEIARQLGLNVSTVKTRAYRARTFLKQQLEDESAAA